MLKQFLRFESVIYPLWRRQMPALVKQALAPYFAARYPVHADTYPPRDPQQMARFLVDWKLIDDSVGAVADAVERVEINYSVIDPNGTPPRYTGDPVRIPAQWEPQERVLLSWGRMYPLIYPMFAQMTAAIAEVAEVEILVPSEMWARGIAVYLQRHCENLSLGRVCFSILRTDDIWIRDYGAWMGISPTGERVALNPTYAVLPQYPQADDNAMARRWAAHHSIASQPLDLHTEGGNLWSDGRGTLIMSSQIFYSNKHHSRQRLLDYLHSIITFEKLIITPRLTLEETGHVDLLAKLATENLVFVSKAESASTSGVLHKTRRLFQRERNAAGEPYTVVELPTPPLYVNWLTYTIRRAYTNALTINGRVLVPTFGIPQDEIALRTYETHLPDYDIVPIDSHRGINGGGAVHCMTREIPS